MRSKVCIPKGYRFLAIEYLISKSGLLSLVEHR